MTFRDDSALAVSGALLAVILACWLIGLKLYHVAKDIWAPKPQPGAPAEPWRHRRHRAF